MAKAITLQAQLDSCQNFKEVTAVIGAAVARAGEKSVIRRLRMTRQANVGGLFAQELFAIVGLR
jgi:hypothetical protein